MFVTDDPFASESNHADNSLDRRRFRLSGAHFRIALRAFSREACFALRMGILSGTTGPPCRGLFRRGQAWPDDGVRVRTSDGSVAADGHRVAALLLFGNRVWPGITLGAFLANATANTPLVAAAGIALGNTLEALAAAWMLRRLVKFDHALERVKDVVGLLILAALLSTMVSATMGVTSLCLGGVKPWSAYLDLWTVWWLGDAMGVLVVTPVLLTWGGWYCIPWPPRRVVEFGLLLVALVAVSLSVFAGPLAPLSHPALAYALFPFVIWAALRFGQPPATLATAVASTIAIWGAVHDYGPFHTPAIHESLILLQLFMGVVATTTLVLAAVTTERGRADISLRDQVDFAKILIESVEAIILLTDTKGQLLRVNAFAAKLTGIDPCRRWKRLARGAHSGSRAACYGGIPGAIVNSNIAQFSSSQVVTQGDNRLHVHWAGRAIRCGNGGDGHVVFTGHDISELEQAQQGALKSERLAAIGRTMIGLCTESRNALQRSQACLWLLERVSRGIPEALNYIDRLQRAQDDLEHIYDDLRDYAQPMRLELQSCKLRDVVEETWADLVEEREGRDASLAIEVNGCDLACQVDRFRVQQVFRNLFENSLSICLDPVRIAVHWNDVRHNGLPALQTTVLDNGPGFTPEQANRAFEVFYTSKLNGTGLGLPIAKRIVEAHGGDMQLAADSCEGRDHSVYFTQNNRTTNHSPKRRKS